MSVNKTLTALITQLLPQVWTTIIGLARKRGTAGRPAPIDGLVGLQAPGSDPRPCKRCAGAGTVFHRGFTSLEGKVYPDETRPCHACVFLWQVKPGHFAPFDLAGIMARIFVVRGGKLSLRKSFTSPLARDGVEAGRAYFVWRLARFHGGADVRMPMVAEMCVGGDPWQPELDAVADGVALIAFGTDLGAAARWGRLLTNVDLPAVIDEPGVGVHVLPATAQEHGPVSDGQGHIDNEPPLPGF